MSETDSFIEEVSEEVRRDRLWGYARRYGWFAVVVILAVVGVTAWNEFRNAQETATAEALGDAVNAATSESSAEARAAALMKVAEGSGDAKVVIEMRRAGALLEAGDAAGARSVLEDIANGSTDPVYADLARLKVLLLTGDEMSKDEKVAALDALSAAGAPFRPLALEQKAIVLMEAGDANAANAILSEILEDSQSPDALRARASQLLIALGGELPATTRLLSEQ